MHQAQFRNECLGKPLKYDSTLAEIPSASYGYDLNDRLMTDTYDDNGNTLVAFGFPMNQPDRYDFENRLIQRAQPGKTVSIVYDGDGNRVRKTVTTSTNTVTTFYLVDTVNPTGYAQVLEEHESLDSQPATLTRIYAFGHALLSQSQVINGAWSASYYGLDGHGNTRFLTDALGQMTDTYDYDAFGNLIAATGSTPNHFLFTTEQFDPDLGLYFLRARYQDTTTGRFWTMDEFEGFVGDPGNLHKYTYAHANPVNNSDRSGHFTLKDVCITVSIIGVLSTLYYHYIYDSSEREMKRIPTANIAAEYNKQDTIIAKLKEAIEDGRRRPLSAYGLTTGGRLSVTLTNQSDPYGQQIRNIWEKPTTRAGIATAGDELSARLAAGFGAGLGDFVEAMANETLAITDEQYIQVLEALEKRQAAYKEWLSKYIK